MEETITNSNNLQETRKKEIPEIIKKYKFLIDEIFKEVAKAIPTFTALTIASKDSDEKSYQISAEEQMYNYLLMREKMIDHADKMLNKINVLELELYAPEIFKKVSAIDSGNQENTENNSKPAKRNYAKRAASSGKE
ncbi:hypothetical protein [Flavobacterium mekongense]|uniref:hypothetical protein n=1 Tax=Flavobacterium mekongense TaxID=3379707 RepID=UPI00399A7094